MYGLLHKALMSWIASMPDGEELSNMILAELNFAGRPDDFFRFYSDAQTGRVLAIISKVAGKTEDECKLEAGKFFLTGILESGYGHSLRTLGDDFYTMLCNLDSLHESFLPSFPKMRTPSVRPEKNSDGSLSIHYYSANQGLAAFMMGSLQACALQLYNLDIEIHHRVKKGPAHSHDIFHVYMDASGYGNVRQHTKKVEHMCTIDLPMELTNDLFPWHFALDREMKIVSVGKNLAARFKEDPLGVKAQDLVRMLRPFNASFAFDALVKLDGASCLFSVAAEHLQDLSKDDDQETLALTTSNLQQSTLSVMGENTCPFSGMSSAVSSVAGSKRSSADMIRLANRLSRRVENIKLHGQLTYHKDKDVIIFFGTPALYSVEEMEAQGINLADMPLHSHGRELLYGSMFQAASARNSNVIDQRLAALDQSMHEVNETKKQVDNLLHSILPPVVAGSLARGEIPPAEHYQHVTVLFSDIAGFTNISSEIPSIEVMAMLHGLFAKFDDLAEQHGCYKVETVGDAYMVAAGCPEVCDDHAVRIARLAIDMVHAAKSVASPVDGEPLRIRIGIHSGPLTAGVVGRARPRYCLFGDTVNVASRMESNGLPGTIQVTYRFIQALPPDHPFEIVPRGHIEIKGKGTMKTFLIIGAHDAELCDGPLLPVEDKMEDIASHLITMAAKQHDVNDRLAQVSTCTTMLRSAGKMKSHIV
eukprot:m.83122 g.83122  ORF g.83122 m.83122 type:complete len:703 (+) comp14333_c0_seq2:65-2173(+)